MIRYITPPSKAYIRVFWKKTEIGRMYREGHKWHYRPRGCSGELKSEEFPSITALKNWLEGHNTP